VKVPVPTPFRASVLRWRRPLIVVGHAALISAAYALAYLLRFDLRVPDEEVRRFFQTLPLLLLIRLTVYARFRLYEGMWRFVSVHDVVAILIATTVSSLIFMAAGVVLAFLGQGFPRSIFILDWILCVALVGGARIMLRSIREFVLVDTKDEAGDGDGSEAKKAVIVGAGEAAERLIRYIKASPLLDYRIVGLVDDDARTQQRRIHDIKVIGTVEQLPFLCSSLDVQEVLIAIPSAAPEERRRIVERCREAGVPIKTVPSTQELISGDARIGQLEEIDPEFLLGRDPVSVNLEQLSSEIGGRSILVTGAGGSIGSELCRQLASFKPDKLVLYERAESNLYFVNLDLRQQHPDVQVVPVVGDILDEQKFASVLKEHQPTIVYHAAAYKHVPLMEDHPIEAIENNVLGTSTVAATSAKHGVEKFVLISTDKAVNPVGIMGMTKRVAESVLLGLSGGPTTFVSVRFGNVLGSDGSVLPLFRWQMAMGGPITITHSEATRYFMLLSEAAQLVLQAGAIGSDGDMFFLDMGDPVRIVDLAENLIRLSGLAPGRDVPLEIVGLRPGERLVEELLVETEKLQKSEHEKIFLANKMGFDRDCFREDFEALRWKVWQRDEAGAIQRLRVMAARY
jgi:FlaA1/EpsC-like NDP-sugar epimerase